ECAPWLLSVFASITLLGQAIPAKPPRRPAPSSPLPEPELGLAGEYSKQSSEACPAALGWNLISAWRQKWTTGSQAFLKRLFQRPGTPLSVLRQQNSSTKRQPHWRRCAMIRSFT